jgi:hypothetical protein
MGAEIIGPPSDHVHNINMSCHAGLVTPHLALRHHVKHRNVSHSIRMGQYVLIPSRFPRRRPVDCPPPLHGELVDGRPTPRYALAWVCPIPAFYKNLGGGELGKVDDCNLTHTLSEKWRDCPKFECVLAVVKSFPPLTPYQVSLALNPWPTLVCVANST